jgi:hypothetical protein
LDLRSEPRGLAADDLPPSGMRQIPGGTFRMGAEQSCCDPTQPEIRIPRKVIKGGSYLCAPNYTARRLGIRR